MDVLTQEQRRKNMQAIRSKNTKTEVLLQKALWKRGHRYRKNDAKVFGKPDLTFKRVKIAIFVDSEYFHGKNWEVEKFRIKSHREFWWQKIENNIQRDKVVVDKLTSEGWKVLRFWCRDISKNLGNCIAEIEQEIINRKDGKIFSNTTQT
jgi:DNA mismatch endonuclease, patch repair protein